MGMEVKISETNWKFSFPCSDRILSRASGEEEAKQEVKKEEVKEAGEEPAGEEVKEAEAEDEDFDQFIMQVELIEREPNQKYCVAVDRKGGAALSFKTFNNAYKKFYESVQ